MANVLENVVADIQEIKEKAKNDELSQRPFYPMIILRTPKGWTGPKYVDGKMIENSFRAHQVPVSISREEPQNLKILEEWLRSYHPEELFDENGKLLPQIKALAPKGNRRMGANPVANGGLLLKDIKVPELRNYGVEVEVPGKTVAQDMMELGKYIRDVVACNKENRNFRYIL